MCYCLMSALQLAVEIMALFGGEVKMKSQGGQSCFVRLNFS